MKKLKFLYLKNAIKNKKICGIILFLVIILIILFFLLNTVTKEDTSNIEIEYIEEKTDEQKDDKAKEIENEYLIQKYKEKKLLALTFDDGPGKYTDGLIDELKKREVNVTFFLIGENVQKYAETVAFEVAAGNEIGIHCYRHTLFTKLTEDKITEQILLTKYTISNITGIDITLIRVPYGSINDKVTNILKLNNLTNILWTVDSKDWKFRNVEKIYNYVLKNIEGNDIILMHDIYSTSVKSAILLVDKLESEGYVFVTVSKFLEIKECVKENKETVKGDGSF